MGKYTLDEVKDITESWVLNNGIPLFEEDGVQTGIIYEDIEIFTPEQLKNIRLIQKKLQEESTFFFNFFYSRYTENDFKKMTTFNSLEDVENYIRLRYIEFEKEGGYFKPSKKLKIGVKKIKETEAAIKNQEKTIKSKKKQILNEQEYLNDMGSIKFKWF